MAVKGATNVHITYATNSLDPYLNQAAMQAALDNIDVTNFDSTAKEYITGYSEWTIPLSGFWDSVLDGYLAPDAVTPGTKRTAVIAFTDDGAVTVTYTWTTNAEIENYEISATPTEAITWSCNLRLSGAPGRT